MKSKILIIWLFMFVIGHLSYAQTVSYSYRSLAAEGCSVTYSAIRQDTTYYILELKGDLVGNNLESMGFISGNIVIPVTEINSTAQFRIHPEQFEFFRKGVAKIRLSAIPIEHERTFAKDKIGKKIYRLLLEQKNKNSDF